MKKIILCLIVASSFNVHSEELTTLNEWVIKNPQWSSRPPEVTYMLGRCASALIAMSSYIKANSANEIKLQNSADILMTKASHYARLSIELGSSIGATEKFLNNRMAEITKIYVEDIIRNKTIHNDAFGEKFQSDINFCTTYYPVLFKEDGTSKFD
jgi:hypothetical protein